MLALAMLSVATARIETIALTTAGAHPAVRVSLSGQPGAVALRSERDATRLVIAEAELGRRFGGRRRVAWTAGERTRPAWLSGSRAGGLRRVDVGQGSGLVYVVLRSSPPALAELRRDAQGLLVVLRPPEKAERQTPRNPRERPRDARATAPASGGETVGTEAATGQAPDREAEEGTPSIADLYPQLFPPATTPDALPAPVTAPIRGLALGPFRLRGSIETRYVDADTHLESAAQPTRDRYLELVPRAELEVAAGTASFTTAYKPALRALARHDQINSNSHHLTADLDLPLGERVRLRARERLVMGTLDTRVVDPGGEYFFDLGRFRRNDVEAALSVLVGPRTTLELGGSLASVHFLQESGFFDHTQQRASLGVGFELTPSLKAVASYAYEAVPRPSQRLPAEARAHSANLTFHGEMLPLLSGELGFGYRNQQNPNAGEGGRSYSGLTFSGMLTRQLTPGSSVSVYLTRALPVSAYQSNGFYVWTSLQASLQLPLPLALQLRFGLGRQWNDYRAAETGGPLRRDRILSWYTTLRRSLGGNLSLSGSYRHEMRDSNLAAFATDSSGFLLQLQWQAFGGLSP